MKGKVKFILPSLALAAIVVGVTAVSAQGLDPQERLDSLTNQIKEIAQQADAKGNLETDQHGEVAFTGNSAKQIDQLRREASNAKEETLARPASERAGAVASIRAFMDNDSLNPEYVSTSRSSYDHTVNAEFYRVGPDYVEVDMRTNEIIQFGPAPMMPGDEAKVYNTDSKFSKEDLEAQAQTLIAKMAPGADLGQLEASIGEKGGTNYFFRWTDSSKEVDGTKPFVQVGLTVGGDLLSYTNTLSI